MVRTVNKITAILNIYCEHVNDRHIYMHKVSSLFDSLFSGCELEFKNSNSLSSVLFSYQSLSLCSFQKYLIEVFLAVLVKQCRIEKILNPVEIILVCTFLMYFFNYLKQ